MGRALVVDSRRLFSAADDLLRTMDQSGVRGGGAFGRNDAAGSGRYRKAYSRTELVEAMSMLIRMGYAPAGRDRA